MAVLDPLAKLIGPRSDDIDLSRRLVLFLGRKDLERIDRALQDIDEDGVRLIELDDERRWVGRRIAFDVGEDFRVGAHAPIALEGRHHVGRCHHFAILKLDAVTQPEGEGLGVGTDIDLGRKHRRGLVVLADGHQRLKDMVDHFELDGAARHIWVEGSRARHLVVNEVAALLRISERAGDQQPARRRQQGRSEKRYANESLHWLCSHKFTRFTTAKVPSLTPPERHRKKYTIYRRAKRRP